MYEACYISVTINRPTDAVYEYVSDPQNLPQWASGLSSSIRKVGEDWIAEAPMGKIKIRFADHNKFGVLDHIVVLESGASVYNAMRVFPNGNGSELVFTLLRGPDKTPEKFADDADWVAKDLRRLKTILEN